MAGRDWSVYRVGLTGGIASGKTAAAGMFAELGVPVIDADVLGRAAVEPGTPALAEIARAFGRDLLRADGTLDRRRLRDRAFANPALRRQLEAILHPRILAALEDEARRAGGPYQVLVVPLLIESGFNRRVDRVLVVDCPEDLQRSRLIARDDETPAGVDGILTAQSSRTERLAGADDVLDNSGSREDLGRQVRDLHARYRVLGGNRAAPSV